MLNGIPFGSPGGIGSDGEGEMESVGELTWPLGFPGATATTLAAASIGQNEELGEGGCPRNRIEKGAILVLRSLGRGGTGTLGGCYCRREGPTPDGMSRKRPIVVFCGPRLRTLAPASYW